MRWLPLVALLVAAPSSAQNRAWIGITLEPEGVKIREVMEGAPGERAGLRAGDEILAIDGARVTTPTELIERVGLKGIGETAELTLRRAGKELRVSLALAARPEELDILRSSLLGKPLPELPAR